MCAETVETGTNNNGTTTNKEFCLRIATGTSNPAKIRAVEQALRTIMERHGDAVLHIQGFPVESGVSSQPFGNDETQRGAKNRARAAYRAYQCANDNKAPHLAIGMEGGLEWDHNDLYCMAWMSIYGKRTSATIQALCALDTASYVGDKKPIYGNSKTALFPIPESVATLVKQGMELSEADDTIFGRIKSKHGSGTVGMLTDGLIERSSYYEHALILALTPWIRPQLFPHGSHNTNNNHTESS